MHASLIGGQLIPAVRQKRPGKEELRNRLRGVISEIPIDRIDSRMKVNERLKRITSLQISGASTESAHVKKPSIEDLIAEMEEEYQRLVEGT